MRACRVTTLVVWCSLAIANPIKRSDEKGHATGPHGGRLMESSKFHLELVLDAKKGAIIYLMNTSDRNPITQNASVYFLLKSKGAENNYYCAHLPDHFECRLPNATGRPAGDELIIKATRRNLTDEFVYRYSPAVPR